MPLETGDTKQMAKNKKNGKIFKLHIKAAKICDKENRKLIHSQKTFYSNLSSQPNGDCVLR